MQEKIEEIILKIKPYINMDGGDIEFISYDDGYVYIKLSGKCLNCSKQDNTINNLILNLLQEEIPEIEGVINLDF